jgi:hypothetical protein
MNTLANALGAVRSERPIRHATSDEDQGLSAVTAAAGRELRQRFVSELPRRSKAGPAAGLVASIARPEATLLGCFSIFPS